jgi:hypothetical protein
MRALILILLLSSILTVFGQQDNRPIRKINKEQNNGGFTPDSNGCVQAMVYQYQKENGEFKKCSVVRTSDNDNILKKYIAIYKCYGGERYIVTLQQKYKLKKVNDTIFQVIIKDKGRLVYEDEPEWADFLWCPIGKPNGAIILIDGEGEKRREYNYKNEMLNGKVIWWNSDETILQESVYANDEEQK